MMLTVTDLSVTRGGLRVLEGLSFQTQAGEALVLRGPNGIGKTTLLRTLAGLQPALSGTIDAPEDSIAYAAHSDGLKSTLTVAENLEFWADIFGTSDIDHALAAFDLTDLRERVAGSLSAGQKRRLGLSRLLVTGRKIWILDEPTVSLDTASVAQFADIIRIHLAQGGMALIATHIDLGLEGRALELTPFKAVWNETDEGIDEAFL